MSNSATDFSLDESVQRLYARHRATADRFCYTYRRATVSPNSLPYILFLGNHSSGKSSFINHLLGGTAVQDVGIAPTDDAFTFLVYGEAEREVVGPAALEMLPDELARLNDFGPELVQRVRVKVRNRDALKNAVLVDSPGMIDASEKSISRGYDFFGVIKFLAEITDLVLMMFDPDKPGTTGEAVEAMTGPLAGFFFKLSAIPFHMWAPDVYQGAPTPVTALLAMSSKAAGLAVFMRVLYVAFPILGTYWMHILAAVSALCMIGGNILAIKQKDVKRMLAYSSIAQAGYMMVGMASADYAGIKAVMFYATLYLFANVGAFAVLSVVEEERGGTTHAHLTGLSEASPMLAAVMTISLVSMAGVPPTAGFAGKIYIFTAAVDYGYIWLAFVGFVMSMMSIYYYLLVVRAMYRDLYEQESDYARPIATPISVRATALLSAAATLVVGVWPDFLARATNFASQTFMR